MASLAPPGYVEGARPEEVQIRGSVAGERGRVPLVVLHYDLVSALAILVDTLQEFGGVSGTHALIRCVVGR